MKTHHLTLESPGASAVFIAGSFNDWSPDATPLARGANGSWGIELALPPGRYEYRFVIDGEWVDDPNATEFTISPFGNRNAVLVVEEKPPAESTDANE